MFGGRMFNGKVVNDTHGPIFELTSPGRLYRRSGRKVHIAGAGEHGQGIRRDWGHFGDGLARHPGRGEIPLVQSTTVGNIAARVAKSKAQPELGAWLKAGGRFEVHGWAKVNDHWLAKIVEILAGELEARAPGPATPATEIASGG